MLLLCMGAMSFLLLANMLQDPHNVELSGNRQSKLFDGEEDYGELVHVCVCVYMCVHIHVYTHIRTMCLRAAGRIAFV